MYRVDRYMMRRESENLLNFASSKIISGYSVNLQMAGRLFNLGVALQAESGRPYSLTTGRDDNHDGLAIDRPAGVHRNSLEGPGYVGFDLRWSKDFFLNSSKKEKGPKVTAGIDAFNVANRGRGCRHCNLRLHFIHQHSRGLGCVAWRGDVKTIQFRHEQ